MPHTAAPSLLRLQDSRTPAAAERVCACGCDRSLAGRRLDATAYDATCRSRLARDRARQLDLSRPRCACEPGAPAQLDPDGDLFCVRCGRLVRAHAGAPVAHFDQIARLMVTDGDGEPLYRAPRRRLPPRWRATTTPFAMVLAA